MSETGSVAIGSVGVVGLGTMGAGIVEVMARAGLPVTAVELNDELLAAGRNRWERSLERLVDRGRLDVDERDAVLSRISPAVDRGALGDVDLVVEAVPERLEAKLALFADLDGICAPDAVLATNTSSLSVTRIAVGTSRPERVVGMHFFNPAPAMRLVEVVHTVRSDDAVVTAVRDLAIRCGKSPVVVADRAGFVANALLFGYLNAAARSVESGQAAAADIDAAMVAACGLPMGPLALLDLIGLDVSLDVLETLYAETGDQRHAAAPLLRRLVTGGQLGRKTGRGYYRYDAGRQPEPAVGVAAAPIDSGQAAAVVGVTSGEPSGLLAALGAISIVDGSDVASGVGAGKGDVVVVDGGTTSATAELVARIARGGSGAVLAAATADDAPLAVVAASAPDADVVGLHLPLAPRAGVVEVVRTTRTAPEAVAAVTAAVRRLGLSPLVCRDRPGHVVDYLLLPHVGDAVRMVDEGYASQDDVETAMRLGCGYPDGPFAMLAAVGADEVRSRLLHLAAATHQAALAPVPLLDELAAWPS